jgi:hypothetical protein
MLQWLPGSVEGETEPCHARSKYRGKTVPLYRVGDRLQRVIQPASVDKPIGPVASDADVERIQGNGALVVKFGTIEFAAV